MINIHQIHKSISYDSFEILGIQINLQATGENYAQGLIVLKSSINPDERKTVQVTFTKEELDTWSEDDSVVIQIIAQKLGFTLV